MATDLYLIRKNQTWTKYSKVEDVRLTSSLTGQSVFGITGSSSTNLIQFPVGTPPPQAGTSLVFTSVLPLTGTGILVGTVYYIGSVNGNYVSLYTVSNGLQTPVDVTANITAATIFIMSASDELRVWSGEFRDIFNTVQELSMSGTFGNQYESACTMFATVPTTTIRNSLPGLIDGGEHELGIKPPPSTNDNWSPAEWVPGCQSAAQYYRLQYDAWIKSKPNLSSKSDELAHANLRQSLLNKTHWKFDRGTSSLPRFLYATWLDGDVISDNPPETT